MAHQVILSHTLLQMAAVLLLLSTPAAKAQGLPVTCPPPTDNGTFPFPIDTSNFCRSLGLNQPSNPVTCSLWSLVKSIVAGSNPLACDKQAPSGPVTHPKGFYIPQPLPNRIQNGKLPNTLPLSILDVEGATYYWLYTNRLRFASWCACGLFGDKTPWQPPQDWQLLKTLSIKENLTEVNVVGSNVDYPIAVVLKQGELPRKLSCLQYIAAIREAGDTDSMLEDLCEGGHVVLMIRGTSTSFEGDLDFNYNLVPDAAYGDGLIHSGFRQIANQLWDGGFKAILDREFVWGHGLNRHLTVNGHSLGGGTAKLLAARAEKYLSTACAARWSARSAAAAGFHNVNCKPHISLVTFAAPNAGNPKFARDFNTRVNARTLQFKYDFVAQVPCSPRVATCPFTTVPTNSPKGYLTYSPVGGRLRFSSQNMPVQQQAWSKLGLYRQKEYCDNSDTIAALYGAVHVCAYLCKVGSYTNEAFNWCLLWPAQGAEAQNYNYCFQTPGASGAFPITNPLYPPNLDY